MKKNVVFPAAAILLCLAMPARSQTPRRNGGPSMAR
jgi:hypothetical protein